MNGIKNKIHAVVGGTPTNTSTEETNAQQHIREDDKEIGIAPVSDVTYDCEKEKPTEELQPGVQKIEAVTLAWKKQSLYIMLGLIWILTLVNNIRAALVVSVLPYATSDFLSHSLLTVITIVASAISGAVFIPMAKVIDLWGRAEGFLVMTVFCVMGLIILAAAPNLPTYCAGQVFYSVGFSGLSYTWDVLAADVTNLRNRGLAFAFTSSPAIISAFVGSKAAESFLNKVHNWRWGFGIWTIILPAIALPIYFMLAFNLRKAEKSGIIAPRKRDWAINKQSIWWALIEFDVVGVFLFAGGFVIFFLPFTLAATAPNGWKTGYIIAMIVLGFVLIISFGLYEVFVAPVPFLKYEFLVNRTVLGACLLDMTYQVSYYCYASYLTSFLQVVYYLDISDAGYVANTFSVVSFVALFAAGWLIRITGRFKWILWCCLPLYMLGLGLMIHFRQPGGYIGYIVMCEIFFSVAGSIFILCVQLASLAAVDHQHVAAVLALLFIMGSIGDVIGSAISGAIWTNTFLPELERQLPESAMANLYTIYESLPIQLTYAIGTPERDAINAAYGYAQVRMLAAGTAFMVLGFVWVGMMKNLNVKTMSQTRGNVL